MKGTAPTDKVANLTLDGWVQVPQESNVTTAAGNFSPNGDLIRLDSIKMATWTDLNISGITAGQRHGPGRPRSRQTVRLAAACPPDWSAGHRSHCRNV